MKINRKIMSVLLIFVMVLSMTAVGFADEGLTADTYRVRIGGGNRYSTSQLAYLAMESMQSYGRVQSIVVANGTNFPDALSGAYLAHKKNAALVLTDKDDKGAALAAFLASRNSFAQVYVLGGAAVISNDNMGLLKVAVGNGGVRRVAGGDRWGTNLEVIKAAGGETSDILVCSGTNFPDALSASGIPLPILLVEGSSLKPEQKTMLSKNMNRNIYVIGGNAAVSTGIENELKGYGTVTRLGGANRYETSRKIAEYFYGSNGKFGQTKGIVMAQGDNFPDGLVGGPLATKKGFPLLLINKKKQDYSDVAKFVSANKIWNCLIMGGEGAVPGEMVRNAMAWPLSGSDSKPGSQISGILKKIAAQREKLPGDVSPRKKLVLRAAIGYVKNPNSNTNSNCYRLVLLSYNAAKYSSEAYSGQYWELETLYNNFQMDNYGYNRKGAIKYAKKVPVSGAEPGDIARYGGHVAIYIGNEMAVHGNYLGRTVIATLYVGGAGGFMHLWHTDI